MGERERCYRKWNDENEGEKLCASARVRAKGFTQDTKVKVRATGVAQSARVKVRTKCVT